MAKRVRYIPAMTPNALMTAEELLHLNLPNKRTELVRGVLVVREPAGFRHGDVAMAIALEVGNFVRAHKLGRVVAAGTGFHIAHDPDTVRAPDVGFVSSERLPDPLPLGYAPFAPDLAVEVLSPDDRPGEVLAKVADWLDAGTRLVWIVDPGRRTARVCRTDGSDAVITPDGRLDGEDVLPGFACELASVF
jgi:Uma2 family endonuclease